MNPFRPALSVETTSVEDRIIVHADGPFGKTKMVFPVTLEKFDRAFTAWEGGALLQSAFPFLNTVQREFLLTGMALDEQEETFGDLE